MKAIERRTSILEYLNKKDAPLSASALAELLGVSRQIIVGDIALLRASGEVIIATPRGYVLEKSDPERSGVVRQIVCSHSAEAMEHELQLCIDYGCEVLDVIVEHPVYGQLIGQLHLRSRYDIAIFMDKVKNSDAHALSELTDGIHIHTLLCPDEEIFRKLKEALAGEGILVEE